MSPKNILSRQKSSVRGFFPSHKKPAKYTYRMFVFLNLKKEA